MTSRVLDIANVIRGEVGKVVVGQQAAIEQFLVALIAGGHVLIEGVPGTAKTLMVKALAVSFGVEFRRVQFTPDLMPADVIGTSVFDLATGAFHLRRGPVFTNFLLADEVNRTPPKTQAALLEAMEERQVTIEGESHPLPAPFMVFATQNPIEYEGTYPLPEAQLDRFMFKVLIDYPGAEEEQQIMRQYHKGFDPHRLREAGLAPVADEASLAAAQQAAQGVTVSDEILAYIGQIVRETRELPQLVLGASPRAAIALLLGGKVLAALRGRDFVIPDDIKELAFPVLRHRLILRAEAEIEGLTPERVIEALLSRVPVPR